LLPTSITFSFAPKEVVTSSPYFAIIINVGTFDEENVVDAL
jgi:hypothetical protein